MTIRDNIRESLNRAKNQLEDGRALALQFLAHKTASDGGFMGRAEQSDLYYSIFAADSLLALDGPFDVNSFCSFLHRFEHLDQLSFIDLTCLARCSSIIETDTGDTLYTSEQKKNLWQSIEQFQCDDGGFNNETQAEFASIYASFLAMGASEDLNIGIKNRDRLIDLIHELQLPSGGFTNDTSISLGATPVTAAAMIMLNRLGEEPDPAARDWLLENRHETGGFLAIPDAPLPDLLSTATAVHALEITGTPLSHIQKETCLNYLETLWSGQGSFHSHWADDTLDCEYLYYGLLTLGHVADDE